MRLLVIVLAVLAASTAAVAQEKAWRLGVLTPGRETRGAGSLFSSTLPVLAERGFVEGRNLEVIIAAAEGDPARLPSLAAALADARPDAIITIGTQATDAALAAAPRTPIVLSFAGQDPVETGHARSLARPGGRVTGIFFRAVETDAKRLELLVEAIPDAKHFGFLAAPTLEPARAEFLARTAERLGVVLTTRTAAGAADFPAVFAALQEARTAGVLVQATTLFGREGPSFAPLASRHRLPTICEWDYMAREGCLIGFGPDLAALRRRTGEYVVRVFEGADPGELPIEQPDRFRLAVNLRVAAELGLTLPSSLLARADEVIE